MNNQKPNFFDTGSPFLAHPLLTVERTVGEVDFLLAQTGLARGSTWLDVGCGFGRHAIELARRGHAAVGIDPAVAMIEAARERAAAVETAAPVTFRQHHAEQFTTETPFDAAICLFTSLGQVSERGENSALIEVVYEALKPGGLFVVEVPQREATVANLRAADRFGGGERYTDITRRYNPADQTITEEFELVSPEQTRAFRLQYRLYSEAELRDLLVAAGFVVEATFADYQGNGLTADSPFMLFVGRVGRKV